jgi:hypothetical protein
MIPLGGNFLLLLVFVLSMSSLETTAVPLANSSASKRAVKPKIGIKTSGSPNNFPTLDRRHVGQHSHPLTQLESRSNVHPQMLLQHHINRAQAKMAARNLQSFTEEDHQQALIERRDAILTDLRRRDLDSRAETSHVRQGISINPKTGKAGKASKGKRDGGLLPDAGTEVAVDIEIVGDGVNVLQAGANVTTVSSSSSKLVTSSSSVSSQPATSSSAASVAAAVTSSSSSSTVAAPALLSSSTSVVTATTAVGPNVAKASTTSKKTTTKTSSAAGATSKAAAVSGAVSLTYDIAKLGFPSIAAAASETDSLNYADTPNTLGSLALNIEANDIGYVAEFKIGTAGTFRLLIDSGSADTWIPSTTCTKCGTAHAELGTNTSTTFQEIKPESDFSITYGTGSVAGHLGNDTLNIGSFALKDHTFGLATVESTDFSDASVPFDGLMGLAKNVLSSTETPTPIDSLYAQGFVSQPVIAYHLARISDPNNDGEVTFGGVNAERFVGDLVELENVSTLGFWEVDLTGLTFAGKDITLSGSVQRTAILDTGTTLIVM